MAVTADIRLSHQPLLVVVGSKQGLLLAEEMVEVAEEGRHLLLPAGMEGGRAAAVVTLRPAQPPRQSLSQTRSARIGICAVVEVAEEHHLVVVAVSVVEEEVQSETRPPAVVEALGVAGAGLMPPVLT